VTVFLDQNRAVPALEQMPYPAVPLVEELRVDAIQLPHAERKIAVRCFSNFEHNVVSSVSLHFARSSLRVKNARYTCLNEFHD
jgi:hypothetical protein